VLFWFFIAQAKKNNINIKLSFPIFFALPLFFCTFAASFLRRYGFVFSQG
jgi:hypothetical protein